MKFVSTRGNAPAISASGAIEKGLAPDGGLYVPEEWPEIEIQPAWAELEFNAVAAEILKPFFTEDALSERISEICARAFDFPMPLRQLDRETSVLELFHGPTNSFKDFGARFLALALNFIPEPRSAKRMVLVATSGDTGSAVASAFSRFTKIPVVILYPKGKISARQEKQLTVWGKQVKAFAVQGSFDDCQRMVKEAFTSPEWTSDYDLISANSINIARLLPQMAYFAYASHAYEDAHQTPPELLIPSGNIGNATAALWAKHLGFPIRKVQFAHNANRAVADYFTTGEWHPLPTVHTLANAMDVGSPSNFERVRHLYPELEDLRSNAAALSVSDDQILETLKTSGDEIWCPHTAAAMYARNNSSHGHAIVVATAHPAKFEALLEPLLGRKIPTPSALERLLAMPSEKSEIKADLKSLRSALDEQRG